MRTQPKYLSILLLPVLFIAFQSTTKPLGATGSASAFKVEKQRRKILSTISTRPRPSKTQGVPPVKKTKSTKYLDAAIQAANWIESLEVRNGDRSTWPINDEEKSPTVFHLYSGSGGVVLFYLELYRATGEKKYLQTAIRGANKIDDLTKSFTARTPTGFWTGMAGYGYVLGEMYRETKNANYLQGVDRCLKHLEKTAKSKGNGIAWSEVTDIISGTAGTGMWLLYLTDRFPQFRKRAINLATQAGDGLLSLAKKVDFKNNKFGLNWMMSPTYARNMPNYSHGTAGICDFLAILNQRIKTTEEAEEHKNYDGRFLKAAKQGAEYLVSIAQKDKNGFVIFHNDPQGKNLFYMGWCHGPAGTGRFFRNLATITEDKKWTRMTEAGAQSLIDGRLSERRVPGFWNNVGMCCGSAGVGNYFLDLNRMKKSEEYVTQAKKLTDDLLIRATAVEFRNGKTGLKWTHAEHRVKPKFLKAQTGIMQGASGIGSWLLKLHAFENGRNFQTMLPEIVAVK